MAVNVTVASGAGVFQYYSSEPDLSGGHSEAGFAAKLESRYGRENSAYGLDVRYRRYNADAYEVGGEVDARYYFHPEPARPYVAPVLGFWAAADGGRTYRVASVGVRVGGLLTAEGAPIALDVFAAYRGRFNFDADERRPAFTSELAAGATCDWFVAAHFGFHAEGSLLWPGFFAEKHGELYGPGVAPFVLVGPAFRF
ncbi:MAG: hypothetical protein GTN49_11865 [candidate division Zixibacteria bacterium]|nr:hypothetical protein [candidate division Zixibacteria bacterium]